MPDRDRPLNERGQRDAPKMGKRLARLGVKPDLILSSPAARAVATARILAEKLDCKPGDIRVDDRLYAAEADDLLHVIRNLADKVKSVMLVGHNPELTELAHRFSDRIAHMPTCAIAVFEFDATSWFGTGEAPPATVMFHTPKQS